MQITGAGHLSLEFGPQPRGRWSCLEAILLSKCGKCLQHCLPKADERGANSEKRMRELLAI
jgi:hypothetical protein